MIKVRGFAILPGYSNTHSLIHEASQSVRAVLDLPSILMGECARVREPVQRVLLYHR
jgi:hypothetical protein